MIRKSFMVNGEFQNLALPIHASDEGLYEWTIPTRTYIDNFKLIVPTQSAFEIPKTQWLELCYGMFNGKSILDTNEEVYELLFCAALDSFGHLYYRIRTIAIDKTKLITAQTTSPTPSVVDVKIYTSPIAITTPFGLKWIEDAGEINRIDDEVDNWHSIAPTIFADLFPPLEEQKKKELYVGNIIGKQRILDLFRKYPTKDKMTIASALFKGTPTDTPKIFIAFNINAECGTADEFGTSPLYCPPSSTDVCKKLNNHLL